MDSKRKGDDLDDFYRELQTDIGPTMPPAKAQKGNYFLLLISLVFRNGLILF